jgi:hypothetical protein
VGSSLEDGFAIYPMVEEAEAAGVVAAVYAALLGGMPFVPSCLFKSLAVHRGYLVLAYKQAAPALQDSAFFIVGAGAVVLRPGHRGAPAR